MLEISILVGIHALLLLVIAPMRGWRPRRRTGPPARAVVIVPCCGDLDGALEGNLRAIVGQNRRPQRVILVARSEADLALPAMRRTQAEFSWVEVVIAGAAQLCGQKNHNLLAGLDRADEAEVYVFADSDIRPDEQWLAALLDPLESNLDVAAATALCGLPPEDDGCLAPVIQSLFTCHQSRFQQLLGVTWGGSMAVRASLFDAARVASEWARHVLDDWVLWRRIAPLGRIVTVPSIRTGARACARTWSDCLEWNIRQFQYFKLYGALTFYILVACQLAIAGVVLGAPVMALHQHSTVARAVLPGMAYLGLSALLNLALSWPLSGRRCLSRWLCASLVTPPLIVYVTCAAWLRQTMKWRGISYRTDRRGRVLSVEVTDPNMQGAATDVISAGDSPRRDRVANEDTEGEPLSASRVGLG